MNSFLMILSFSADRRPRQPARPLVKSTCCGSGFGNVGGLRTLGAFGHLEVHLLAFSQRPEATFRLDGREMHEHILVAVFRRDEAKTLVVVEEFDTPCPGMLVFTGVFFLGNAYDNILGIDLFLFPGWIRWL